MGRAFIEKHWPALVLGAVALAWRFFQIRDLLLPAWVDSVHHALLVRILLEQHTLPATWGPYLADVPLYYHFGFHLTAALFAHITGLSVGQAVLVAGQMWQGLLAVAVYSLAYALWQNRGQALASMLLVVFVLQMPAYLSTWGRYTLVAGLTLLIFAIAAILAERRIILALLVAAAAITHFYALFLLTLFLGIVFVVSLLPMGKAASGKWANNLVDHPPSAARQLPTFSRRHFRRVIGDKGPLLLAWAAGLLLASPWLWRVFLQVRQRNLIYVQTGAEDLAYTADYVWYLVGPGRNYALLLLALLGAAIVLVRFVKAPAVIPAGALPVLGWSIAIVALMGPWRLGPFRPDHHAAVALFIPAALFAPVALWRLRRPAAIWGALLLLVIWGGWDARNIINPATILANQADVAALEWVADNTPSDANFMIDVAPWSAQWRGADGGWWITPLTGRQTVLPPAAYGWGSQESVQQIRAAAAQIYGLSWLDGPEYCRQLAALMAENRATHYYSRSSQLSQCPALQPVYQGGDDLAIYQFKPENKVQVAGNRY